ncbi:MAG: sulfatase-like hydrolase/transferase [Actinomycetota bacterium]
MQPARRLGSAAEVLGAITGLLLLGVGQPLLDLLSRNATFFVARGAPRIDIVLFTLGLVLLLPAALSAVVLLAGRLHEGSGRAVYIASLTALGTLLGLRVLNQVFTTGGALLLIASLAIGAAIAWIIITTAPLRSILQWAPLLAIAVAGWFLFASPAARAIAADDVELLPRGSVERPSDVVMLIFDELPLASVLNRDLKIDERLFPNLARLADSSNWYRNATTVSDNTARAVPALLDGVYPRARLLPTAADHPRNIFTMLGADYRVEAEELVTRMCPQQVCRPRLASFPSRMRGLLSDTGLIAAHMLLPEDMTGDLPPVDENWGDFAAQTTSDDRAGVPRARNVVGMGDPPSEFRRFIHRIAPEREPTFYFKHVLLPHAPWRYLSEGYEYPQDLPIPGTVPIPDQAGTRWGDDAWLAAQGYQRHMLQAMVVDHLLGELLDALEAAEMYEDTLIVMVSDHGTSFVPGAPRRSAAPETVGSVAPITMFIKDPGQTSGRVIDAPVQTIDILPTLAALLGIRDPWEDLDGQALVPGAPGTTGRRMGFGPSSVPVSDEGTELQATIERKYATFRGRPLDPYALAPPGTRGLLDAPVPSAEPAGQGTVQVDRRGRYSDIDLEARFLPALLTGRLEEAEFPGEPVIAVGLNGRIAAVTQATATEDDGFFFQAMLSPARFRSGVNDLRFFLVESRPQGPLLLELQQG